MNRRFSRRRPREPIGASKCDAAALGITVHRPACPNGYPAMATGGAQLPKTQGPPGRVTGEQGDRGRIPVNLAVLGYVLPVSWGARALELAWGVG